MASAKEQADIICQVLEAQEPEPSDTDLPAASSRLSGISFSTPSCVSLPSLHSSSMATTTLNGSRVLGEDALAHTEVVHDIELDRVTREIESLRTKDMQTKATAKAKKELVVVRSEDGLSVLLHPKEDKIMELDTCVLEPTSATSAPSFLGLDFRVVDEAHTNYVLMYDMLTGIRTAVSRCQAKPSRPLTDADFTATHKLAFDLTGTDMTPSSRYDFKFKDYSPWVFRTLRESFNIDTADYLVSLTGKYILSELYSPGKSGSLFYYSQDYRFIIKTIRRIEHRFLRQILRHYHEHMHQHRNSLLVKFFGLHRLQLPDREKIYFVVMSNIFSPARPLRAIYDLKGSTYGRYQTEDDANESDQELLDASHDSIGQRHGPRVLKDLNWLEHKELLILGPVKAKLLMRQLRNDCKFLASLKIMDYSLLIGFHDIPDAAQEAELLDAISPAASQIFYADHGGFQTSFSDNSPGQHVYYLGIIDILTPYTLRKRLEHTFKSLILPKASISAVKPSLYARRLLAFMKDNILQTAAPSSTSNGPVTSKIYLTDADYSLRELPDVPRRK